MRQIPGLVLNPPVPATNMVFLSLAKEVKPDAEKVFEKLKRAGVLADVTGPRGFRLVLHYWIDDAGVEKTVAAFAAALR